MPLALENQTPRAQLRLDRLPLRFSALFGGLTLYGVSAAMLVRSGLGAAPWDVFHVAVSHRTGIDIGIAIIGVSFVVLLLWIPLRQWPGIGTLANAVWIGLAADATFVVLPPQHVMWIRIFLMLAGVVLNGIAGGFYIGAQLGPGPRDGLMTGIHLRTGWPIGPVRIGIELVVLLTGWLLGGPIGIGTIAYALGVGPITHVVLPRVLIPVRGAGDPPPDEEPAPI